MNPLILGPIMEIGSKLIDRWMPDPEKKAAAELEFLRLTQEGDLKQVLAQLEINAKEAMHPTIWVAGWRPFVGWTCGVGLVYHTIIHNILEWVAAIAQWPMPPALDSDLLIYVLGSLLGVSALRTYEKKNKLTK